MGSTSPVRLPPSTASLAQAFGVAVHDQCLESGTVFVGLFELAHWRPWLDHAAMLVDAREMARARAQRKAADRDDLVLCYALHRLLLGHRLGCDAEAVPLRRDAAGCPRVDADGIHTSLSHAGGAVAAAVSASGPVGVDIEPAARAMVMDGIIERLCHPQELAGVDALSAHERGSALLRLWVRKEACLKAAGTGLAIDMCAFPAADGAVLALPAGHRTQIRMLEAGRGWVAAAAAPPGARVRLAWLRPGCGRHPG